MVYRTCFRFLASAPDAEDATQATFLILARQPTIVKDSLSGWLHKVAHDTAINLLKARQRRACREQAAALPEAVPPRGEQDQLREEIDFALQRLPGHIKEALVLRYLEGRDAVQAASLAGCSERTLVRYTSEGLDRLRSILTRRGTVVASAALIAFLAGEASAAVPAWTTAQLSLAAAGGGTAAVASLADKVAQAMFWAKVKLCASAVAAVTFVAVATPLMVSHLVNKVPAWRTLGVERTVLKGHSAEISFLAFSPDGQTLASASYDRTIRLWDSATGQQRASMTPKVGRVHRVAFFPDGKTLVSQNDDFTLQLWDVATGREIGTFGTPATGKANTVLISPDGKLLVTGNPDGTVRLWDFATRQELVALRGHTDQVCPGCAFSPDSALLATPSYDRTVIVWDVARRQRHAILAGHSAEAVWASFSPNGRLLASASWDGTVKLWDIASGTELRTLRGHSGKVASVAFAPDGTTLVSGGWDGTVKLWDASTGVLLASLDGNAAGFGVVAFSPDGKTLAVGSNDGMIKLRDAAE